MINWFRRRRLSPEARRRLLLLTARAEEAVIETHVRNALELLHELRDEVDLDRGLALYEEAMSLQEPLSAAVRTRVLARWNPDPGADRTAGAPSGAPKPRARSRHLEV